MKLREKAASLYVLLMGRPEMQRLNNAVLAVAQRAKGYNNFHDVTASGEAAFLRVVQRVRPSLCVDVGANVGDYTALLLGLGVTRVIAFEPLEGARRKLALLERSNPGRLEIVPMGVGDHEGHAELTFGAEDSPFASFSPAAQEVDYVRATEHRTVRVELTTLDRHFADLPEIDLLKIDTEGFESNVLRGARRLLELAPPKFIQIEFNWHQLFLGQSLHGLAQLLPAYDVFQLLPHGSGLVRVDPRQPDSNLFHFSNFAFVRKDVTSMLGLG